MNGERRFTVNDVPKISVVTRFSEKDCLVDLAWTIRIGEVASLSISFFLSLMQKYSDIEHETIFFQMKLLIIPEKWLYFSSFSYFLYYEKKKGITFHGRCFFLCVEHPDIPPHTHPTATRPTPTR